MNLENYIPNEISFEDEIPSRIFLRKRKFSFENSYSFENENETKPSQKRNNETNS